MIKELNNLRVRAIAVSGIPEYTNRVVVYNGRLIWHIANPDSVKLPPGDWQILGRCEDVGNDIDQLATLFGDDNLSRNFYDWIEYCQNNSLAGELILIDTVIF